VVDDSIERFHRLVRSPEDAMVITPPQPLLDEIERLGQDPRRPRTAIARWASRIWLEHAHTARLEGISDNEIDSTHSEKELMERPSHYPDDWGLDLIPFPSDLGGSWTRDKTTTLAYTSLTTPRPFDPQLHGDVGTSPDQALGFGYNYQGKSGFPDQHDIVARRGGGPRGGFAMTTGPTEGAYPTAILPQPVFNLGRLGFSNGGWNPEGLQWTNRPKRMRLGGLRNGWAHRVFFARSRRVMFRNLFGAISEDEATPLCPTVVVNGMNDLHGILSVSMDKTFNAPTICSIEVNNPSGRRTGTIVVGDTIQIYAAPRTWADPPLVFTGYVSEINESTESISVRCSDALGYLGIEVIKSEPHYYQTDAATVIKDFIANSNYSPPIGRILNQSFVILPAGILFAGMTRLKAVQGILNIINSTPNLIQLYCSPDGMICMKRLKEVHDSTTIPYVGGRLPRTASPQDFYATGIERESGDSTGFNVVVVSNPKLNILVSIPVKGSLAYPNIPVERIIKDESIINDNQAKMVGEYMLNTQGLAKTRWVVEGIPERLDIETGQIMEFASVEASLAGRQRIFNVSWQISPAMSTMTLNVGRQAPDLLSTLKFAAGINQG